MNIENIFYSLDQVKIIMDSKIKTYWISGEVIEYVHTWSGITQQSIKITGGMSSINPAFLLFEYEESNYQVTKTTKDKIMYRLFDEIKDRERNKTLIFKKDTDVAERK